MYNGSEDASSSKNLIKIYCCLMVDKAVTTVIDIAPTSETNIAPAEIEIIAPLVQ
jgi:hypothetical protein